MPIADLKIGLRHSETVLVGDHLAVPAMSESYTGFSDMPPVFATAFMIGLVEWACVEALSPFLGAGEHTVGIHVDFRHVSADRKRGVSGTRGSGLVVPVGHR